MTTNKLAILIIIPLLASCASDRELARKERIEDNKLRIMSEWDLNADGVITCEDSTLRTNRQFDRSDIDNNSILDVDEFRNAPWGSKVFAQELFFSYDLNKDGEVDLPEFSNKSDKIFVQMDKNQDCTLSESEIEQSLEERRRQRPQGTKGGGRGKGERGGGGGRRPS